MPEKDLLVVISEMLHKQDKHSELINETNDTIKQFMGVSIKQFEQQQIFNEKFLKKLDDHRVSSDHLLNRFESIDNSLQKLLDMENRIKRLESAVFK